MNIAPIGLAVLLYASSSSVQLEQVQQPTVVVELFTSEGCSSCPPADAFLSDLARQRPDILSLSFHVTYWNDLGWKDPFSLPEATNRQRNYARFLGDDEIYTPEMVINGALGMVGSRRDQALADIARAKNAGSVEKVRVRLTRDGDIFTINAGDGVGRGRLWLVGFDSEHETHVGRGENSGRTLHESNIVRSFTLAGTWSGASLKVQQGSQAGEHFAVLLQAEDGQIIGAARLMPAAL